MTTMKNEQPDHITPEQAAKEALNEKLADSMYPGFRAEFDAKEAELAGAFSEDALDERDAEESAYDLSDDLVPAFLDADGPSADLPMFITTTNSAELYGLRPDETVAEAIARKTKEG